jgi:hypothetical protein
MVIMCILGNDVCIELVKQSSYECSASGPSQTMETKMRAQRRHHRNRRIRAEFKKWVRIFEEEKAVTLSKAYHSTRTPCSCFMCGNPRKWFKELTQQEKKSNISYAEQKKELD